MAANDFFPKTPAARKFDEETSALDQTIILRMDRERRERREVLKRAIYEDCKKRGSEEAPALIGERPAFLKRRRVGLELVLDDTEKENNYTPSMRFDTVRIGSLSPMPSPMESSSDTLPLVCRLRPRNLNSAFNNCISLSSQQQPMSFDDDDDLPYMPL